MTLAQGKCITVVSLYQIDTTVRMGKFRKLIKLVYLPYTVYTCTRDLGIYLTVCVQISWFSYETICHVVFANVLAIGGMLNNMGLEMLMNMFGGLGAGSMNIPSRSDVPPEQLYATQLSQLQEMGFFDTQENIRALTATAGNVHAAVERLLGNPGQ